MLIFTGADGNYALQAQVWFMSLVKTQCVPTRVLVFGNGWSDKNRSKMKALESPLVKVEFREVDETQFSKVRLKNGFPLATAYNVLAPSFLLKDEQRAIYMDADMVVTEDLSPLWNMHLSSPIGAVLDAHIVWMASPSMWRPWREEGLHPLTPYLNTGLMLLDLERWRSEQLTERTLHFLKKYDLPCVDQDALNLALRGIFDQLHPRYNSMPYHHLQMLRYLDTVESDKNIGEAINNPAIIHYHRSFFGKPWTFGCTHPGVELWRQLASEVNPRWRKKFDLIGSARAFAAKKAKMTKLDSRSFSYGSELSSFQSSNP
jgi:lipopolysaccharide biosynthesis glycosyltransferase